MDGVAVTPAGRPLSETFTGSEKPFTGAVVMESNRAEPPPCRAMEAGADAMVKSGTIGGITARAAVAV